MANDIGYFAIEKGSQGPADAYPYITYEIINSHVDIGATNNVSNEVFEMIVEFEAHVSDVAQNDTDLAGSTGAATVSNAIRKFFINYDNYQWLVSKGIIVVFVSNTTNTTNIISMQVERSAAFQVRFRVKDNYQESTTKYIEQIEGD